MSLFKVCQWYSIQTPETQLKFDSNSLHCCRLALNDFEKDYIIVGSHSGYLCVYQPSAETLDDGTISGFASTSVVLETKLPLPVIGLESGKFSNATNVWSHLAVLHPMKLSVFTITTIEGVAEYGGQSKLNLVFEYNLKKFAFSVCKGSFGSVKGREFLCVLHMDGSLRFYEQDGITYDCHLPGERNIPSPIAYCSRVDSFVTVSPAWDVECFRYQDLTQATEIFPMWSFCIGESVLNLAVHQISNSESVILILGEHNFYCLSDTGKSKFIKRLDFTPMCFYSFVIGWYWEPDARLMIAIASDSGSLLIYNSMDLIWAAQLPEVPIALQRANLQDIPGAIVSLSELGNLHVGYLGSDPQMFKVPPLNLKDLDFDKTQIELEELEKEIKRSVDLTDMALINSAIERDCKITVNVGEHLEKSIFTSYSNENSEEIPRMCAVNVDLEFNAPFEQVQISLVVDLPLQVSESRFTFRDVEPKSVEHLSAWVYLKESCDPNELKITVIGSCINRQSIPRVIQKTNTLPMTLIWRSTPPQKEAAIKITMHLKKSLNIAVLFPEYQFDSTTQVVAFISNTTNCIVTIVQAKNSSRFRIQSDNISAVNGILSIFIERVKVKARSPVNKSEDTHHAIKIDPTFPMELILKVVDEHYQARETVKRIMTNIEAKCGQMRVIERRLIVKIQDRTPNALGGILNLLKSTHLSIAEDVTAVNEAKIILKRKQMELSSAISLVQNIVQCLDVPAKSCDEFLATLVTPITDCVENGWEEVTWPPLELVNYTSGPLRKNKNSTLDDRPTISIADLDLQRFKKQLASVCDRVIRLSAAPPPAASSENNFPSDATSESDSTSNNQTIDENVNENDDDDEEMKNESSDWMSDDILGTGDILKFQLV